MIKVTLVKSIANANSSVKATVAALGLKKIRSTKTLEATPANLGQIKKVAYLLKVEEV
jgi:large subunit ribosomal protein L30